MPYWLLIVCTGPQSQSRLFLKIMEIILSSHSLQKHRNTLFHSSFHWPTLLKPGLQYSRNTTAWALYIYTKRLNVIFTALNKIILTHCILYSDVSREMCNYIITGSIRWLSNTIRNILEKIRNIKKPGCISVHTSCACIQSEPMAFILMFKSKYHTAVIK